MPREPETVTRKPDDAVGTRGDAPAGGGRQTADQAAITEMGTGGTPRQSARTAVTALQARTIPCPATRVASRRRGFPGMNAGWRGAPRSGKRDRRSERQERKLGLLARLKRSGMTFTELR